MHIPAGNRARLDEAHAPPRFLLTLDLGNPGPPSIGRASVNVQNLVENSSLLSTNKNIQVNLDQGTVVLRGNVATERERRLAEGAPPWRRGCRCRGWNVRGQALRGSADIVGEGKG